MRETELQYAARKASEEIFINQEKMEAFIKGAQWAVDQFSQKVSVHPMEEHAGATDFLDKLRLKDVRAFISEMWSHRNKPDSGE